MQRVVIIGAGDHAREVAEILRHQLQRHLLFELLGFVVEEYGYLGAKSKVPVLGDWSWLEKADKSDLAVICAIGSPATRKRLVERARSIGLSFINAISPSAYVSPDATLGQGNMIFPSAVVSTNTLIHDHTIINFAATISHDSEVQSFATIAPGVHVAGNVLLGEGCCLGIGSTVIPRASVGAWTTVGSGASVIRDLPEGVTAVGVPAEIIKWDVHERSTCRSGA